MIVSCQDISKSFGGEEVLRRLSLQIREGDKVALVGSNGAGKSTLLKIIAGELDADSGQVVTAKDTSIGYLAQYQNDMQSGTVYEIVHSARQDLLEMKRQLREMEQKLSELPEEDVTALLEQYHAKNAQFDRLGGYSYDSEVGGILKGLGFSEEEQQKTLSMLSGGQKTRVALGRLLVKKPDLLLLDEPINHLDLSAIQWLETYLNAYKGTMILVAHDRYFLDRIVNAVFDIGKGQGAFYKGNYSAYVKQKAEKGKTLLREYEKQQAKIAHQEEVIDRLKQFNREKSIRRAESRQKALDKIERIEAPQTKEKQMKLMLEPEHESGGDVMELKGLGKSYNGRPLFEDFSFLLRRGEHVAILGDNGTGKTTLLKIINGRVDADTGFVRLGANVSVGYYDQEQQQLDDRRTLFEEMQEAYPNLTQTKIRNVLAAFMFFGDDCFKKIGDLSGGERGRISLAKLMLSGANFLILDEPTNHLDMESKEILEQALNRYSGTLLYVSHDRYFINRTAHKILELDGCVFREYLGDYDDFLQKKTGSQEEQIKAQPESRPSGEGREQWKEQKRAQSEKRKKEARLLDCEKEIEGLEETIKSINEEFLKEEVARSSERLNELSAQRKECEERLEEAMQRWERLAEEVEDGERPSVDR